MTTRKHFHAKPLARVIALASMPLVTFGAANVAAQESSELQELRDRVQTLERTLEGAVSTAPELQDDNPYLLRNGDGIKLVALPFRSVVSSRPMRSSVPAETAHLIATR